MLRSTIIGDLSKTGMQDGIDRYHTTRYTQIILRARKCNREARWERKLFTGNRE